MDVDDAAGLSLAAAFCSFVIIGFELLSPLLNPRDTIFHSYIFVYILCTDCTLIYFYGKLSSTVVCLALGE